MQGAYVGRRIHVPWRCPAHGCVYWYAWGSVAHGWAYHSQGMGLGPWVHLSIVATVRVSIFAYLHGGVYACLPINRPCVWVDNRIEKLVSGPINSLLYAGVA